MTKRLYSKTGTVKYQRSTSYASFLLSTRFYRVPPRIRKNYKVNSLNLISIHKRTRVKKLSVR